MPIRVRPQPTNPAASRVTTLYAAHAGDRRDRQVGRGRRASGAAACRENIRIDNRGFCIERQDAAGKILRKIASAAL